MTRADGRLNATLSLVDTRENRIEWGATESGSGTDYTQLAVALVRRLGEHLGSEFPDLYDYVTNLTGSPEMAASPTTASALAAGGPGEGLNVDCTQFSQKRLIVRAVRGALPVRAQRTSVPGLCGEPSKSVSPCTLVDPSAPRLSSSGGVRCAAIRDAPRSRHPQNITSRSDRQP